MFHKSRRNGFLLKETPGGTWMTSTSVFAAANAKLPMRNIKAKAGNKEIERYIDRNSLDSLPSLFYGEEGEISFDTDVYGSGAAGTVIGTVDAGFDLLMKTLHSSTVTAGTSVVYALNVSAMTKISAGVEFISEDGTSSIRFGIKGAMVSSLKLELTVGGQGVLHWVLKGPIAYESNAPQWGIAGTPVANITRDVMVGRIPQFKGLAFQVGGVQRLISKLTLDYGISTEYQIDSSDPTTYQRSILGQRKPTISFDPEIVPKATQDDFGELFAGTSKTLSLVLGSTPGQIFTWSMPNIQRTKAEAGERGAISTSDTVFRCNGNSDAGEDSILLALT